MLTRKGTERVVDVLINRHAIKTRMDDFEMGKRCGFIDKKANSGYTYVGNGIYPYVDLGEKINELEKKVDNQFKVIETLLRHLKLVYKHIETEDVIVPAPEPHGYGIYVDGHPGATISWDTTKKRKKRKE